MHYHGEERAPPRRQCIREAIALAMQSRWEEAVAANRSIIESFPGDAGAYNRLARALVELGECAQAQEAYSYALKLDPHNKIAKKNLARLSELGQEQLASRADHHKVIPQLFVEETGKAGMVALCQLAPKEVLARMVAGAQVHLKVKGQSLIVEDGQGEYLGQVEPKHGLRLRGLMEGGNEYTAAIARLEDDGAKVIIKEAYQHPSQQGRLSFPLKDGEIFRPYVRDSLLRYELDDEESIPEAMYHLESEAGPLVAEASSVDDSLNEDGPDRIGGEGEAPSQTD
jgi:hypothetical protein